MTRYTPLWLQSGSYAASVDRRLPGALWPTPRVDGMGVSVATGTTVNVAAGTAAVPTANNTGSTLCVSDAVEQVALPPAPASGLNRVDLVIVRPRGTDLDGGVNNDFIFDFVTGAEAATGTAPATPPGTVALARVNRTGGSAAVVAGDITDVRPGSLAVGNPPTPPPVTSGSTIQSFTDAAGEVWVAKNGVNGGAWRRARDVLHARVWRAAALSSPSAGTNFKASMDSVSFDDYGIYSMAQGRYNLPIPGMWRTDANTRYASSGGAGVSIYRNGAAAISGPQIMGTATPVAVWGSSGTGGPLRCAANDFLETYHWTSAAGLGLNAVQDVVWHSVSYLGSG